MLVLKLNIKLHISQQSDENLEISFLLDSQRGSNWIRESFCKIKEKKPTSFSIWLKSNFFNWTTDRQGELQSRHSLVQHNLLIIENKSVSVASGCLNIREGKISFSTEWNLFGRFKDQVVYTVAILVHTEKKYYSFKLDIPYSSRC